MKLSSKLSILLFGIGAAFVSTGAMAQVSSSASISDTGYRLIDLDPTDGITAAITFTGVYNSSASFLFDNNGGSISDTRSSVDSIDPLSTALAVGGANVAAGYSGTTLHANAQLNGARVGDFDALEYQSRNFTLTPNTLLVFFGHATGSSTGNGNGQTFADAAFSRTSVEIVDSQTGEVNNQITSFSRSSYNYRGAGFNQFDTNFTLAFINDKATAVNGRVSVTTEAQGRVSPVPEPATYGMMLGGLALVAGVFRRRRTSQPLV